MKKNIKKIIDSILIIVLVGIIVILANIYIQQKILNRKYVNFFGYSAFLISTGSMSGTIEIDDIILVKITNNVELHDIISFEQNDIIITHRVVEITNENLITKGDANNTQDEPITRDAIVGKVVKVFEKAGIWLKVFSDVKVLIAIFTTLILFAVILSFNKENKSE